MDLEKITKTIDTFSDERDWKKFHSIKNLTMALSVESSELVEIYQWLSEEESNDFTNEEIMGKTRDEIADIFIYLNRICSLLQVDLEKAVLEKIAKNALKYPAPEK
jgi:dCTP diphosphatase